MAIYNVHAGHCPDGQGACGAVGILYESTEARKVKNRVIARLRQAGHTVYDCTSDLNTSQNGNLGDIVSKCNQHNVDYDISIHLNSGRNDYHGDNSTGGVEVWCYNSATADVAARICANVSKSLNMHNRGVKYSTGLYVLRNTNSPALLVECCFVDDKDDANRWNSDKCGDAIAEGIMGRSVSGTVSTPTVSVPSTNTNSNVPRKKDLGNVDIYYQVKTTKWWGVIKNRDDWAGAGDNKPITAIAMKVSKGTVEYQVHVVGKGWYGKIKNFDINDIENGFAGDGVNHIDAIRAVFYTPEGYAYKYLHYKVSPQGMDAYFPGQIDDQTVNGQDGYAGVLGRYIDKVQMWIE